MTQTQIEEDMIYAKAIETKFIYRAQKKLQVRKH